MKRKKTGIWIIGDSGIKDNSARAVRDAYYNFVGSNYIDIWLMLGDNTADEGTDFEYQNTIFEDMYDEFLKQTPVWPSPGHYNHEGTSASTKNSLYNDIFTLPKSAEAGGTPSGTESYYSFDYSNIHFISMDSHDSPGDTDGAMMRWLKFDLAATDKDWIIAYWHNDGKMRDMRENFLPVLEDAGVDLILSGHSYSYKRSYLLHGDYSSSYILNSNMILDEESAKYDVDCSFEEVIIGTDGEKGTFSIAGNSGLIGGRSLTHPTMFVSLNALGSMLLNVNKNRLDARFINNAGNILDEFTIFKNSNVKKDTTTCKGDTFLLSASWAGMYIWTPSGDTTRTISAQPQTSRTYIVSDLNNCLSDTFNVTVKDCSSGWEEIIKEEELLKIYPNPNSESFFIEYELFKYSKVKLEILDIKGKLVRLLVDENQSAGTYFYQLDTETLNVSDPNLIIKLSFDRFSVSKTVQIF